MPYKSLEDRRRASRESQRRRREREKNQRPGVDAGEHEGLRMTQPRGPGRMYTMDDAGAPSSVEEMFLSEGAEGWRDDPDARRQIEEQGRMLQQIFDTRYARTEDFKEFAHLSDEMSKLRESLQGGMRDSVEASVKAYMESGPGSWRPGSPASPSIQWQENGDGSARATIRLAAEGDDLQLARAYAFTQNRQGAANSQPVGGAEPWFALTSGNPLLMYAMVVPAAGSGFRSPQFHGGSVKINGNLSNTLDTPTGIEVAGSEATTDVYDSDFALPRASADWIPMARQGALMYAMTTHSGRHGLDAITTLKAGKAAGQKVATGQAAALPGLTDLPGKLAAMLSKVAPQYRSMGGALDGAAWVVSAELEGLILSLFSSAGFAIDPTRGLERLLGFPLHAVSHADTGGAASDVSGYFGAWQHSMAIGLDLEFDLVESVTTRPGAIVFIAHSRQGRIVRNSAAYSYLQTAAA